MNIMKRSIILMVALLAAFGIAEARQPRRGYRGFIDWSNSVRSEEMGNLNIDGSISFQREGLYFTGFSTSHSYQINPMFFVGAGFGMERCVKYDNWVAPVFIDGRIDLKFDKFTPYGDLRLGANLADGAGVYFSPTIGYRFDWGRKTGLNLGASLTLAGYRSEHYEGIVTGPDSYEIYYVGTRSHVRAYFSFRLGIDF